MSLKKIRYFISIVALLLIPQFVFASNGFLEIELNFALFMEAFCSIHMSAFVLKPISEIFAKENGKKVFWILFAVRALILIFFDFFVTTSIAIVDFFSIFALGFILVPTWSIIKAKRMSNITPSPSIQLNQANTQLNLTNNFEVKCAKCGFLIKNTDKFCSNCGERTNINTTLQSLKKIAVNPSNFDSIYNYSEERMLEEVIKRELTKVGVNSTSRLLPNEIINRKKVLSIIFSVLVFVYISLIFFHLPLRTYVIGAIILIIFLMVTKSYNLIKYLKKQLKARPSEKISNIILYEKNNMKPDDSKPIFLISFLVAFILPFIIFSSPRIFYEKTDGGYAVRFYTFGINNFKTAAIPEYYKNEKVVVLRGNTFSNMYFLESVSLPNSIVEIRGQAFKNCLSLSEINIPTNLEYLGGGAFYNAKSITSISLPDTLTYMGGEVFYGATSLESVKLSENLTEIRGDSFEYCDSLTSISIPDKVTRIGGHAFYDDSSLSEVYISENSQLAEIGSSAFRLCSSLYSITIPNNTYVNERAFKESPTVINHYARTSTYNSTTNNYYN